MDRILRSLMVSVLLTLLLLLLPPQSSSTPLPPQNTTRHNTTIDDLVQHQTNAIRKIVSNHKPDYPIITRHPPDEKQKQNDPSEDLKIKCQQLNRRVSHNGFYITTEEPPSTTPKPTSQPIKYIKLEPVILQKTIMSDGRTIYYWHKSIPGQINSAQFTPTPPTTTTTTTTASYNFRNFFPSFYSIGNSESIDTTTTEKTTAPDENQMYQQQLKFVVPVPFVRPEESVVRKPWDIDQYAYYPKPLQPESVNVQMPYVPTFHVIKAIAVPNQNEDGRGLDDFI